MLARKRLANSHENHADPIHVAPNRAMLSTFMSSFVWNSIETINAIIDTTYNITAISNRDIYAMFKQCHSIFNSGVYGEV